MAEPNGSRLPLWLMVGIVAALLLPCLGLPLAFFLIAGRTNARCPACKREFLIPEEHRGNVAQWTREYACPNCGQLWPAGVLYRQK